MYTLKFFRVWSGYTQKLVRVPRVFTLKSVRVRRGYTWKFVRVSSRVSLFASFREREQYRADSGSESGAPDFNSMYELSTIVLDR